MPQNLVDRLTDQLAAQKKAAGEWQTKCNALESVGQKLLAERDKETARLREDAERIDFLQKNMLALDTEYGEKKECVLVFSFPYSVSANLRRSLDAAIDAAKDKP
jgi:hypothetical protein